MSASLRKGGRFGLEDARRGPFGPEDGFCARVRGMQPPQLLLRHPSSRDCVRACVSTHPLAQVGAD